MSIEAKKKYKVQGISFPDEALFEAALARAREQRRSLSNYICGLIEADLASPLKKYPPLREHSTALNEPKIAAPFSSEPASPASTLLKKISDGQTGGSQE